MVTVCDICGQEIEGKPRLKYVEGAKLQVCQRCSKFGRDVSKKSEFKDSSPKFKKTDSIPRKIKKPISKNELDLVDEYNVIIRTAREKLKLTQDELGNKINEPVSLIKRIEQGKVHPPIKIVKKLEKILNVSLLEEVDVDEPSQVKNTMGGKESLTLGDMVIVKKKKKDED